MKPVRWSRLVWLTLGSGVATWLALNLLSSQGIFLPLISRLVIAVILLLALFVAWRGWLVRRWVATKSTAHMNPLQAVRTLVMAQAGAQVGALLLGWYCAQSLVFFTHMVGNNVSRFRMSLVAAAAALVLVAASVLAQRWCRRPPHYEDSDTEQHD